MLGLEKHEQRLVPNPVLVEARTAGELEHQLCAVDGGHYPPDIRQHRSVTPATGMIGPGVVAGHPLPGDGAVTPTPSRSRLIAVGAYQVEVAFVAEVKGAQRIQ